METTPTQRVVKAKAMAARQALRQVYNMYPGEMSKIEKGLIQAVAILIQAIEDGVSEAPHISTFATTPDETRALDELYASIQGGPFAPKFTISFLDADLTLEDIWPNGDAPENPTPEDVIEVMKETEFAHPMTVASAWRLIDTLYVRHYGDTNGDMEVEWDGS